MLTIENHTVLVAQETTKLLGFRLEDTSRAPAVIVFIDEQKPQLLPLRQGQTPPTKVKSANMETEIEIITYAEIDQYLNR
ncbi:hypothetical protein [Desulfobulbus alkaliphilus]|uniref:hypothetical protein n=1 Tax=Desulfobulbus alkaliphilus TaxID=869814 RepID=UPI001966515A|nr:hypothetical protein [Desulfobulbus alkaliphilus]MBM9537529.1 hypothetical protein [Desulfobulbus alkaliphilus]